MEPQVEQVFNDLDEFKKFCIQFGWVYNEADLYTNNKPYMAFLRFKDGKRVPNNWVKDSRIPGGGSNKRKWHIKKK